MVEQAVADGCFVDIARLRVGDLEMLVAAVTVRLVPQIAMKRENIVHETKLELLHVALMPLSFQEFTPCAKQILDRNDILVGMSELNSSFPKSSPPPQEPAPDFGANQRVLSALA